MRVAVFAPHPDDETLGAGGSILRHRRAGDQVHWIIATRMGSEYSEARRRAREKEIASVTRSAGFRSVTRLGFEASRLDEIPKRQLVASCAEALKRIRPHWVYIPFHGDAHSDHAAISDAVQSAAKWFRHSGVERILAYETLSETGQVVRPKGIFVPNVYQDITAHLAGKIRLMSRYRGEMGSYPFPRSARAIRALAEMRGSSCGFRAAEAFMLIREIR